jgi:hypothetical protein
MDFFTERLVLSPVPVAKVKRLMNMSGIVN